MGEAIDRLEEELAAERDKSARREGRLAELNADVEVVRLTVAEANQNTRAPVGPDWRLHRSRVTFNPETGRFVLVCIWTAPPLKTPDE